MIICLNCLHVSMYGCAYIHMHTCACMCEMNLKDICPSICPSVHAYMQIGVYITLFAYVCAYMHICVEVFMLIHAIFG